jgi:hypothetical protein
MKHAPKNLPSGVEIVSLDLVVPNVYTNSGNRKNVIENLIKDNGLSKGAELGLKNGTTMAHVLSSCKSINMIGVDLWDCQPDNDGPENYLDWNFNKIETIAREKISPYSNRATLYKMTTNEASLLVEDNSLDFIFIDADHSEKGVLDDINNWAPKVKDNGYILGHDVAWKSIYNIITKKFKRFDVAPDQVWICKKGDLI